MHSQGRKLHNKTQSVQSANQKGSHCRGITPVQSKSDIQNVLHHFAKEQKDALEMNRRSQAEKKKSRDEGNARDRLSA